MTEVEIALAILVGIFAGMVFGVVVSKPRPVARRSEIDALAAAARKLREDRVLVPAPGPKSIAADLSQVLAILDGPARDSETVRVARDRLDVIRRNL